MLGARPGLLPPRILSAHGEELAEGSLHKQEPEGGTGHPQGPEAEQLSRQEQGGELPAWAAPTASGGLCFLELKLAVGKNFQGASELAGKKGGETKKQKNKKTPRALLYTGETTNQVLKEVSKNEAVNN